MEEEIYTLLSAGVAFPVAWGSLGSGASTPRAVMFRTSAVRDYHMSGLGNLESSVQIDCYGSTYAEAIGAIREILTILDGYQGGTIQGAFLRAMRDQIDDDADLLHRVSMTFSVHHRG